MRQVPHAFPLRRANVLHRGLSAACLCIALGLAACGDERDPGGDADSAPAPYSNPQATPQVLQGERGAFAVRELAGGLVHPWSLAFLPDGAMLVTERPGRLRRIDPDGRISAPLAGVPKVFSDGQSGLLDVVLSPSFADDRLVYLSYGEANWRGNKAGTAVARGRLGEDGLEEVEVIFRQEPKLSSGTHIGARLAFDAQGHLFASAGDNRASATAQQLDHLQGKVVRLQADGGIPADNPFTGRSDARAEIWSYGHRNIQGMAVHPATGVLWTHEHGPRGGDEINLPQAGRNYGWPLITYGREYSGGPVPEAVGTQAEGLEQPHHYWAQSPAISGMAFYTGEAFPAWRGNLFIGALAGQALIRLELDGDRVVHEERLLEGQHRIRDVRIGPDGFVYLLTDNRDGKLLRIEPVAATPKTEPPAPETGTPPAA